MLPACACNATQAFLWLPVGTVALGSPVAPQATQRHGEDNASTPSPSKSVPQG